MPECRLPRSRFLEGKVPTGTERFESSPRCPIAHDDHTARNERFEHHMPEILAQGRQGKHMVRCQEWQNIGICHGACRGNPNVAEPASNQPLTLGPVGPILDRTGNGQLHLALDVGETLEEEDQVLLRGDPGEEDDAEVSGCLAWSAVSAALQRCPPSRDRWEVRRDGHVDSTQSASDRGCFCVGRRLPRHGLWDPAPAKQPEERSLLRPLEHQSASIEAPSGRDHDTHRRKGPKRHDRRENEFPKRKWRVEVKDVGVELGKQRTVTACRERRMREVKHLGIPTLLHLPTLTFGYGSSSPKSRSRQSTKSSSSRPKHVANAAIERMCPPPFTPGRYVPATARTRGRREARPDIIISSGLGGNSQATDRHGREPSRARHGAPKGRARAATRLPSARREGV